MSQVTDLLVSSARSIFETTVTKETIDAVESGDFPQRLWAAIEDSGLDLALAPESRGGAEVSFADAAAILRVVGAAAAPAPIADSMIARRLLADCGLDADPGPLTVAQLDDEAIAESGASSWGSSNAGAIDGLLDASRSRSSIAAGAAPRVERDGDRYRATGEVSGVPFARFAVAIVVPVLSAEGPRLAVVPRDHAEVDFEMNISGEPRDLVRFSGVELDRGLVSEAMDAATAARVRRLGAFSRAALMSGALQRILAMTVDYARERIQFGRPIGQFQAMQQELAVLAAEAAAAQAAADAAADAIDLGDGSDLLAVAVAKMRAGEAAGKGSKVAHQVHGAIGFTHEHELHRSTRRLWAWREECGSETWWAEQVGTIVLAAGSAGLWPLLTRTAERSASR